MRFRSSTGSRSRSSENGLVELGSRPVIPRGGSLSGADITRDSPGTGAMVELSSHGVCANDPGAKEASKESKKMNDGVVEHGSHRVAPAANHRQRSSGVRTAGSKPVREGYGGLKRAQTSDRSHLIRPDGRTAQVSRPRHVEFWMAKENLGTGGKANWSEVTRFEKNVRLLKRGMHDGSRKDQLNNDKCEPMVKPCGPGSLDPIILGGAESYSDLEISYKHASCGPLLLREVGCELGQGLTSKQQDGYSMVNGPGLTDGPLVEINGELNLFSNNSDMGREMGSGPLDDSQLEETREVPQGEAKIVIGPKEESSIKIIGNMPGKGDDSGSIRTEGNALEKINFRDESVRPNFPTPLGFS